MTTAALAPASTATALAVLALVLIPRTRARRRAFDSTLAALHEQLQAISAEVEQTIETAASSADEGVVLDLDALLSRAASEAAVRADADVVAIRVDGVGGSDATAAVGPEDAVDVLERVPIPSEEQHFRAVTVVWSQAEKSGREMRDGYGSAIVVPILEEGARSGVLVACATESDAFGPDRADLLESLARELASELANARRLVALERRTTIDPVSGLYNATGLHLALERELERARWSGEPVTLVVLNVGTRPGVDVAEVGAVLQEIARAGDVLSRPRDDGLAILLPGTTEAGGRRLWARIQTEVIRAVPEEVAMSAGIAQWRQSESRTDFARRAAEAASGASPDLLAPPYDP